MGSRAPSLLSSAAPSSSAPPPLEGLSLQPAGPPSAAVDDKDDEEELPPQLPPLASTPAFPSAVGASLASPLSAAALAAAALASRRSSSMGSKVDHKSDEPCQLSHKFLTKITNNFDEALIVGRGGFGTVYKGTLENGEEIAVKVLRNMSGIDNKEFQKEFENLGRLKHKNVVVLVGFCNEAEKVIVEHNEKQVVADKMHTALCFEYVCNGSLAKRISADGCSGLNWLILYRIIKGICEGLEYLRHGLESPVWHLDLKPSNILLDNNMIPKLADFGLSRLLGDENTRKTINLVGTRGYLPPEYIEHGLLTKEFDIFGLGVIIAKLMAGRDLYSEIDSMSEKKFINRVHGNWRKKLCETLAPRRLEVYCEQVKICIQIALKCMNYKRHERPTIRSIVSNLAETEILIHTRGLQTEQLLDEEPILSEGFTQARTPDMAGDSSKGKSDAGRAGTASADWKRLPLQLLKKITNDFCQERILGTDVVTTAYKGIMEDGEMVMVKKARPMATVFSDIIFINGARNILSLKHENVVHSVGACYETYKTVVKLRDRYITADITEYFLCYEYLPNGDLQKNLFEVPAKMDWETRFKIIKGICQGLLFVHSIPDVHAGLEPRNILLDNNMRPKLADFGFQRLFQIENNTARLKTEDVAVYTYVAPEFLYRGEISPKADIYSLGIIILETSMEERNVLADKDPTSRRFIENVQNKWTEERIASKYPLLDADCLNQIKACIEIGLRCVNVDRRLRPSIEEIVDTLDGLSHIHSNSLLSLQPQGINFPIKPKRLPSSSLYLINKTDDRIAFRLVTQIPKKYRTKLPFCGIVLPKCTYTLNVITPEQKKAPPSDSDDSLTLQSSIALHEDLDNVDPASMAVFLDTAGDEVQEAKVVVPCDPLAETVSNQVIDGPNYREVLSIDVHPTEPWILTSNHRGYVCIWNYQTQEEVDSVEVTREPVHAAKFIEREEWFVLGSGDGYIHVYSYNTIEEVVDPIEAHDGHSITCLAMNPTHSFVLSASDDHTIKLWDWTNEWQCTRTFKGHDDAVTHVMFDPRNSESFASASLDQTVKIWNIHSATCNLTWDGHQDGQLCLHYHPRYFEQFLISGSSDGTAKVWDLEADSCVNTLQGHTKGISALCWHPELRVLVTGSLDGTVQIWKSTSTTYSLENIIGFNLGVVNALGYLKGSTRIVVGCDQGIALMEINVV